MQFAEAFLDEANCRHAVATVELVSFPTQAIVGLASQYGRYDYRRITARLLRACILVFALCRPVALQAPPKAECTRGEIS